MVTAAAFGAGCSTAGLWHREADFPASEGHWEVPLLDPLTTSHLRVRAQLAVPGDDERSRRSNNTTFIVDSGAGLSALPASTAKRLDMTMHERPRIKVQGASGAQMAWRGVHVPRMRLGSLELRDLAFFTGADDTAVLGNNLLKVHPWEVDLDRGVIVFGSQPWNSSDEVTSLPLAERRRSDFVEVTIDGHPVLLYLDTGAVATSIDAQTATELGLPERALGNPRKLRTMHRMVTVRSAYRSDKLQLGARAIERVDLLPLEKLRHGPELTEKVVGLLGMDVLSRFHFRVDPEKRLQLRARRSLRRTAAARCGRWSWAPRCEGHPGCLRVQVPDGTCRSREDLAIEMQPVARYDRPVAFLLGCVTEDGGIHDEFPFIELLVREPRPSAAGRFTVDRDLELPFGRVWAQHYCESCRGLAVVDVNPLVDGWPKDAQDSPMLARFYPRHPLRL